MTKSEGFQLNVDDIVGVATEIFLEKGLDAVSMRSVSARLGVSPVPLYSRIGNKEDLLDAMADHLLANLAPSISPGERWPDYATRWSVEIRRRLLATADSRLILRERRDQYVEATRPLIHVDARQRTELRHGRAGLPPADLGHRGLRGPRGLPDPTTR